MEDLKELQRQMNDYHCVCAQLDSAIPTYNHLENTLNAFHESLEEFSKENPLYVIHSESGDELFLCYREKLGYFRDLGVIVRTYGPVWTYSSAKEKSDAYENMSSDPSDWTLQLPGDILTNTIQGSLTEGVSQRISDLVGEWKIEDVEEKSVKDRCLINYLRNRQEPEGELKKECLPSTALNANIASVRISFRYNANIKEI